MSGCVVALERSGAAVLGMGGVCLGGCAGPLAGLGVPAGALRRGRLCGRLGRQHGLHSHAGRAAAGTAGCAAAKVVYSRLDSRSGER